MTAATPRRVRFRDIASWISQSCGLVFRKPLYWISVAILLWAVAIAITFVPIVGNYLRMVYSGLFGALTLALAFTQLSGEGISLRRALSILAPVLPALLVLSLLDLALFAFIDLPVLRAIATDREFDVYALTALRNGSARHSVDLVHTIVLTLASSVFGFAAPLVMFSGSSLWSALRGSVAAFALSFPVYVTYDVVTVIIPHTLAATVGIPGIALFLIIAILLTPSGIFMYRSAFGGEPLN